jgi:SOS-response transcriptional repressor LexA
MDATQMMDRRPEQPRTGDAAAAAGMARLLAGAPGQEQPLPGGVWKLRELIQQIMARRAGPSREAGGPDPALRGLRCAGDNVARAVSAGRRVPVINRVAAGYPTDFTDLDYPPSVADEYIRCPDGGDPQAFGAHVVGDSMEPKYREGDLVIFSPNTEPHDGDDCFVRFAADNSTTFKRFRTTPNGRIRLMPINGKYPAEEYDPRDINGLWPATIRVEYLRQP